MWFRTRANNSNLSFFSLRANLNTPSTKMETFARTTKYSISRTYGTGSVKPLALSSSSASAQGTLTQRATAAAIAAAMAASKSSSGAGVSPPTPSRPQGKLSSGRIFDIRGDDCSSLRLRVDPAHLGDACKAIKASPEGVMSALHPESPVVSELLAALGPLVCMHKRIEPMTDKADSPLRQDEEGMRIGDKRERDSALPPPPDPKRAATARTRDHPVVRRPKPDCQFVVVVIKTACNSVALGLLAEGPPAPRDLLTVVRDLKYFFADFPQTCMTFEEGIDVSQGLAEVVKPRDAPDADFPWQSEYLVHMPSRPQEASTLARDLLLDLISVLRECDCDLVRTTRFVAMDQNQLFDAAMAQRPITSLIRGRGRTAEYANHGFGAPSEMQIVQPSRVGVNLPGCDQVIEIRVLRNAPLMCLTKERASWRNIYITNQYGLPIDCRRCSLDPRHREVCLRMLAVDLPFCSHNGVVGAVVQAMEERKSATPQPRETFVGGTEDERVM